MEHVVRPHVIEEVALELEIGNEWTWSRLYKVNMHMLSCVQRSSLSRRTSASTLIQRDLVGQTFPRWPEADLKVSDNLPLVLTVDVRPAAQGNE